MTTELSFDQEQLAAALERVVFTEDDVLSDIQDAQREGSCQTGTFPMQGQAQFQIYPVLTYSGNDFGLAVVVMDSDQPGAMPDFTVVLKTRAGEILTSRRDTYEDGSVTQTIPLDNPAVLIGARLEWVA